MGLTFSCARRVWVLAGLAAVALPAAWGGTFGTTVPIGGQAADIALDEGRGVLYIANYAGNRIDVMNTADQTVPRSINAGPLPGSIALSPDGQFLLVANYANFKAPANPTNTLTLLNLNNNTRQTIALGAGPLAVAFGGDGKALVVTTADVELFDPNSGALQILDTIPSLAAKTLPVTPPSFPPQITESAVGVSGDGTRIYGTTEAFGFIWDVPSQGLFTFPTKGAVPPLGPRVVSVSQDGSYFAFGWATWDSNGRFRNNFTNVTGQFNVGSYAIDSVANTIYAQVPQATPVGPAGPVLQVLDADNLTVREYLQLPENLGGRTIINSTRNVLYAISDSGVMVLPIGALNQQRRVVANVEDLVFRGNFCDRSVLTQPLTLVDPSGGATDFTLTASIPGVTISPSAGVTPATISVSIDPQFFVKQTGTQTATIQITSSAAVNVPAPVRVLINSHEPDQRGAVVDVPGILADVLADPARNRFYIIRQDKNQVLVFDATSYQQIATLRTNTAPTQMAITRDNKYLLVGHGLAWNVNVYDLDAIQAVDPIMFPYAHYPFSIAVSGGAILAVADNRQVGRGYNTVDRVDLDSRSAIELPSLGPFENKFTSYVVMAATANGASIFGAAADGGVFLYNSSSDSFPVYRKDFAALQGAFAASNDNQFVVDNNVLNASLVRVRALDSSAGVTTGFVFTDQGAVRTVTPDSGAAGIIQRYDVVQGSGGRLTRVIESTLRPNPSTGITTNPNPFTRALAALPNGNGFVALSQSGFTVLPNSFDLFVAAPLIDRVVNSADLTPPIASGGLFTVFGQFFSGITVSGSAGGASCVTVNDEAVPVLLVSPGQINAQMPFDIVGDTHLVLHAPGGLASADFVTFPYAPAIFHNGTAGSDTGIPAVFRATNNTLVTQANPVHKGDDLVIYATGLGATKPAVQTGVPAPVSPLAAAALQPTVTIDGAGAAVSFAGLVPGQIGVYQINVKIPKGVTQGLSIPLQVQQGSFTTTVGVRVVD